MMWKTLSGLSLLSLAVTSVSAKSSRFDSGAIDRTRENSDVIPGRFIVELHSENSNSRLAPGSVIDSFYNKLKGQGVEAKAGRNFTANGVFEGTTFHVDPNVKPDEILALDLVKAIWPLHIIPLPKIDFIEEPENSPSWSSHANTRVLDLHKKGYLGEGAVVAIIDTGIDYKHPALGGGIGPDKKITGGTDVAGDEWVPGATPDPDNDFVDCHGHGTHVSGIVAGEPPDGRFISVAPKAKLRGYKVFGCGGSTDESLLISGFLQAYLDGVDVINCSVGGPNGWTGGPWQFVADRMVQLGVFVSISAGNFGDVGSWYASSGSTGTDVLAVASIDNEELYVTGALARTDDDETIVKYNDDSGIDGWGLGEALPVYATSNNTLEVADACDPLPKTTPDLSPYLVLIRRGTCNFSVKEANVAAFGAKYIWFYTDDRPVVTPSIEEPTVEKFAMINAKDGAFLVEAIVAGKKVSVFFPKDGGVGESNTVTGGTISTFSEWGPTWEGFMKPEIAAPGGAILSTYPVDQGSYAVASGTSMSSPYIAGIAALYYGKYGGRAKMGVAAAKALKHRIISSGTAVPWNNGTATDWSTLAPIAQQGGGYVDAFKVLEYTTSVTPGKLELNDTTHFKAVHYIDVRNDGTDTVIYTISHFPAATIYTFETNSTTPKSFPPQFAEESASIKFVTSQLAVRPGDSGTFTITFAAPKLDSKRLPVYGGKIIVAGTNGDTLEVPYQGILGDIKEQKMWAEAYGIPEVRHAGKGEPLTGPTNFTLTGTDRPAFIFVNDWGTKELRLDLVDYDYTETDFIYPRTPGQNKYVGTLITTDGVRFPLSFVPRHNPNEFDLSYSYYLWTGTMEDGTLEGSQVAPGKYRFNIRALKVFGNPEVGEDWQSVISHVITIVKGGEVVEPPTNTTTTIATSTTTSTIIVSTSTTTTTTTTSSTTSSTTSTSTSTTSTTSTTSSTSVKPTETGPITVTRTDIGGTTTAPTTTVKTRGEVSEPPVITRSDVPIP